MPTITIRAPPPHVWGPSREWCLAYVCSLVGILKIAQIVLVLIAFLCSIGYQPRWYAGDGWVNFVTITAFLNALIWFILHLLNVASSNTIRGIFELVVYSILTLFLFIAGIVVAVAAGAIGTLGASAFFCFVSMLLFGADAVLQFFEMRGSWQASTAGPPAGGPSGVNQQQPPSSSGPENPSSYPTVHY